MIAALVPIPDMAAWGLPYELRVLDPRGSDMDRSPVTDLVRGIDAVERWWLEINRERANDNRVSTMRADDHDRAVPRIPETTLLERMAMPASWYKYHDLDRVEVLFRRLAGVAPTANQNVAGGHLQLVSDQSRDDQHHDRGRNR